jgi:arsenical pump membrane protein
VLSSDGVVGTVLAVAVLALVVVTTVTVRRGVATVIAVASAVAVVALGLTDVPVAADEIRFIAPTIAFLAAMLVVADVCARTGVFTWVGWVVEGWSHGSPNRLLRIVFMVAAVTTAVLSIDTTIVLLTPVAVITARRLGARITPVSYAGNHLANTASTLFPVSNLTNLLAFSATGLSFLGFAGVMAAPWIAAIVVEYLIFRWFFADDLTVRSPRRNRDPATPPHTPRWVLTCLALLFVAFVVSEPLGVPLAATAAVGAAVMLAPMAFRDPTVTARHTARALNVGFLAFVAALGVIILPVREGAIGDAVSHLIPTGSGFLAMVAVAVLAAISANVVNNLPATLLLVPLTAHQPALVLAVVLGVNIGPNLAYFGSLANLLWRDIMRRDSPAAPRSRDYLRLGALTVPPTLLVAVVALWISVRLGGL